MRVVKIIGAAFLVGACFFAVIALILWSFFNHPLFVAVPVGITAVLCVGAAILDICNWKEFRRTKRKGSFIHDVPHTKVDRIPS